MLFVRNVKVSIHKQSQEHFNKVRALLLLFYYLTIEYYRINDITPESIWYEFV